MSAQVLRLDPFNPRCWACEQPIDPVRIETEAALRGREEADGGPFRVFLCSHCNVENGVLAAEGLGWILHPLVVQGPDAPTDLGLWLENALDGALERFFPLLGRLNPFNPRRHLVGAYGWWKRHQGQVDSFIRHGRAAERGRATTHHRAPHPRPRPQMRRPRANRAPRPEQAPRRTRPAPGSPHDVLGVDLDASLADVKRAFRRAVKRVHPDRYAHLDSASQLRAHERFRELRQAYETLSARLA